MMVDWLPLCAVAVSTVHVESIAIVPILATLAVGETKALNVTVLPENATDKSVTWSSSNESIVRVDENGNIIAIANGTATITARSIDSPDLISTYTFFVASQDLPYVAITSNGNSTLELNNNGGNNPEF